jgi:uncharacterized protein (TIGR02271 family)
MPTTHDITSWKGRTLLGTDDDKLGTIDEIYLDEETGKPEWMAVKTGLFGSKVSFVPLTDAQAHDDQVRVPYDKSRVKDAPTAEADGHLSQEEEAQLYRHYGYTYSERRSDSGLPEGTAGQPGSEDRATVGRDTSGPETDDAMTRSEEELRVGTRKQEAGRARLRKYIVTEQVQTTVPVSHEEVRIEREPITNANRDKALSGSDLSEEEHEIILHEEQAVVEKNVVAKERVRLASETVTEDAKVDEAVRKERIETDGDTEARRRA